MTEQERGALGSLDDVPESARAAFRAHGFSPMPRPGPSDWLSAHPEPGQTFDEFVASQPNVPDKERRALSMVPLGSFGENGVTTELLSDYAHAFFAMPVRVLPGVSVEEAIAAGVRTRTNAGRRQLRSDDVLGLLRQRLPADAFSLSAFTLEDLYPEDSWNFVFGQAALRDRVGVFSFARYDASDRRLRLRRALNVMAHETAHMFGLQHCIYFACLMNGSNHLAETDRRPLHACPVCLHKLTHSIRFDVAERYRALEAIYLRIGFVDDATWTRARLVELGA
jgi:archaemetzincin